MNKTYAIHLSALTLTKTADGLIDPKLVLAWLLNAIGAPGYLVGVLVPVRESGALLPQLLLARLIERSSVRKHFWAAGSALQGIAAFGMAGAAVFLDGQAAGWTIVAFLAILAVARSSCSASFKDVLARTVDKGKRGKVSGSAGTFGAIAVFAFAILLSTGVLPREPRVIAVVIALAGGLWLLAAGIFSLLDEPKGDESSNENAALSDLLDPLKEDAEFRYYVATRALFISTALAPPFLVMLGSVDAGFGNLGILILASSIASIVSSYFWGALSDRSSRQTLMIAGVIAAATFTAAALSGYLGFVDERGYVIAAAVFVAQIAYQGARAGRKTHLTDMDSYGRKAVYTALSNTLIGVFLLVGGLLGALADWLGTPSVLVVLAVLSAAGVLSASQLSEVQSDVD